MKIGLIAIAAAALSVAQTNSSRGRAKPRDIAERGNANAASQAFDRAAVNVTHISELVGPGVSGPAVVRIQILLDRAHFSPGEIDGRYGDNLHNALTGYQIWRKLDPSGTGDPDTWRSLDTDTESVLVSYSITPEDVQGPFEHVPDNMMAKAVMKALGYESPLEELGERFHISPKLLEQLNSGKSMAHAGEVIFVPNHRHAALPPADRVIVSKTRTTVTAIAADGTTVSQYPATIGSEHDPLPIGDWKVTVVQHNPWFNFNPSLFWDANSKDAKARIAPGPNNPVGVVWIGLSKEHYGIHGTAEPANIGHAESHGCIRLTNWDAEELSTIVKPGTPVILQE